MKKALSIFLTILASPGVWAGEPGESFDRIPRALIDQGVDRVGDLDLRKFVEEGQTIRWRTFKAGQPPPKFAEGRRSAFYLSKDREVHVSDALSKRPDEEKSALELHEALGALGYNDKHYNLSTSLEMIRATKDPVEREKLRETLGESVFDDKNLFSSGSGSSVSGGGDILALEAKHAVLKALMKSAKRPSASFLKAFALTGFEPLPNPKEQFVALKYNSVDIVATPSRAGLPAVPVRDGRYQELLTVYIPTKLWNAGGTRRAIVIKEARDIVTQISPVPAGAGTVERRIPGCRGSLHFPKPTVTAMGSIQEARTSFLLRCDPAVSATEIRSPTFTDYRGQTKDRPLMNEDKAARSRFYACSLKPEGRPVRETFVVHAESGRGRQLHLQMFGLAHGTLFAYVFWGGDGKIDEIKLRELSETRRELPLKTGTGSKPAEVTFRLSSGERGRLTCTPDDRF